MNDGTSVTSCSTSGGPVDCIPSATQIFDTFDGSKIVIELPQPVDGNKIIFAFGTPSLVNINEIKVFGIPKINIQEGESRAVGSWMPNLIAGNLGIHE